MELLEALSTRISARAFLDTPVPRGVVREIIELASQAPSGSNMQPWQIHAVAGDTRRQLIEKALSYAEKHPIGATRSEYQSAPEHFVKPYKSRRFACGMALYTALGIDRKDKAARAQQLLRNFYFFDAPVGLIFSIHRCLMPGQLGDLGILMANVMLAAREFGLHTCAQGFWQDVRPAIHEVLDIPEEYYIYNGMALGHIDENAAANQVKPGREPVDSFTHFLGF
ncbi:MAG TPA: nitroreductase family protein [Porticoccaceae bacterium]|nr:nitroreductase family protein [Porticoccaceae bacterium]